MNFSRLLCVSFFILLAACAPKKIEISFPQETDIRTVLSDRNNIVRIDAKMDVLFEKQDSEIGGDAMLDIFKNGDMHLKVFFLGIPVMDMASEDGIVTSIPKFDKNRTLILSKGIRDSLFWWDMEEAVMQYDDETYILQNSTRQLWIDRRTMLPRKQKISFENGRQIDVFYDNPATDGNIWYQSKMRIEMARYAVTLTVKEIVFINLN